MSKGPNGTGESDESGEPIGRRASPKLVGGLALMGSSFIPFAASFIALASDTVRTRMAWIVVALVVLSNALWYGGILLMGPDVYKALRKRWRARRRKKEQPDGTDTRGTRSDRVGALGASGDDQ